MTMDALPADRNLTKVLLDAFDDPELAVSKPAPASVDDLLSLLKLEDDESIHDPYRIDYLKQHVQAMEEAIVEELKVNVLHHVGQQPSKDAY